jgi:hypothetical protein
MLYYVDSLIAFVGVILLASLIVTVLTQMVIAVLNLRGKNLLWGLKQLISEIEPSLKDNAEAIVKKVLNNPMISMEKNGKGFWRKFQKFPAVIRREEFSRLLVKLAESEDVKEFGDAAAAGLRKLTAINPDELIKQLNALPTDWREAAENELKKVSSFIFDQVKTARLKIMELEAWFDHVVDRLSQRFARYSKIITVCGAVLVALLFRLDSIQLLKQISSDQELRTQLLANVAEIQEMGNTILGGPTSFDMAFQSLKSRHAKLNVPAQSILSRESAEQWLQDNPLQDAAYEQLSKEYETALTEASKTKLGTLGNELTKMNATLSQISLKVFGSGEINDIFRGSFWKQENKIIGILVSIVLLSLGAPFWFNMLKNLTNLRTRLMKNEEDERLKRQETK